MSEHELFQNYEIKGLRPDSRLFAIIGATVLFHAIAFTVIGQLNLLQTKACDSPYIGKVCEVLDVAYVGSIILGKDYVYTDKEYEKTEIDPSDVTFIEVTEPFNYPDGYFALSNPQTETKNQAASTEGFPAFAPGVPNTGANLLSAPQVVPTPNNNAVIGPIPDSPIGSPSTGRMRMPKYSRLPKSRPQSLPNNSPYSLPRDTEIAKGNAKPSANTSIDANANSNTFNANPSNSNTIASDSNSNTKTVEGNLSEVEINRRPLKDYGQEVKELVAAKEVDLTQPFSVSIKGVLKKDGKLDTRPGVSGYLSKPIGDEKLVNIVKSGIEAANASGYLTYLKDLSGKDLKFEIKQDDKQIVAVIQSEMESVETARKISSALNFYMEYSKNKKLTSTEQDDIDDLALLQNAKVTSNGKTFELRFEIPQKVAQDLITRKLAALKDGDDEKKNNSNGVAKPIEANKIATL